MSDESADQWLAAKRTVSAKLSELDGADLPRYVAHRKPMHHSPADRGGSRAVGLSRSTTTPDVHQPPSKGVTRAATPDRRVGRPLRSIIAAIVQAPMRDVVKPSSRRVQGRRPASRQSLPPGALRPRWEHFRVEDLGEDLQAVNEPGRLK